MKNDNSLRITSAAVMLIILAVLLWINNITLTWIAMGIVYIVALKEAFGFYKAEARAGSYAIAILVWIGVYFSNDALVVGTMGLCAASLYAIASREEFGFKDIFPFVYPTLPFVVLFDVYQYGVLYLVWLLVVVAIADVFAYYGGRIFGKTKLSDKSPGKTIEGALCGFVVSSIVGSISGIGIFGSFGYALIASIIIVVFSIIGDLFESTLKRNVGIKDSGSIIPGHGGVLDRVDAILFAAIAMVFILSMLDMYNPNM